MTTTNAELIKDNRARITFLRGRAFTEKHGPGGYFLTEQADRIEALTDALEAATTTIAREREARRNHPVCERHADDGVSCGWKSVVLDIDAALSNPEEAS